MANNKEEQEQRKLHDVVNEATSRILSANSRGTLKDWAGEGYYSGMFRQPWWIKSLGMGTGAMQRFGDAALDNKIVNKDNKYDQNDVEMGRVMQKYVENANKAFTGASFTDNQLQWIKRRMPHLMQDPDSVVGSAVSQRLASYLSHSMMEKMMRSVGVSDEDTFNKRYPDAIGKVRARVDMIMGSDEFNAYERYLVNKYTGKQLDPKTGEMVETKTRPKLQQSDFNPYVYAPDIIQKLLQAEGSDSKITDLIDYHDFSPGELPGSIVNKDTLTNTYVKKSKEALAGRIYMMKKQAEDARKRFNGEQ